jgi:hypothetical protein
LAGGERDGLSLAGDEGNVPENLKHLCILF